MENNTIKTNKEQSDAFASISSTMVEFREEMESFDAYGIKIAGRTRFVLRMVFAILTVCSIYLVLMIVQMANNMTVMTSHLENMYGRFGAMSQDMHEISRVVDSMGMNISGMPEIAQSMIRMNDDVNKMKTSVFYMNSSVTAIDNDMVSMNLNMMEMTGRLSNMNRSVNLIGNDVNQMSRPMNSGPLSGFWPR